MGPLAGRRASRAEPRSSQLDTLPNPPPPYREIDGNSEGRTIQLRRVEALFPRLALVLICALLWFGGFPAREEVLPRASPSKAASVDIPRLRASLNQCAALHKTPVRPNPTRRKINPRWNAVNGQAEIVILRNATLFDGEKFVSGLVDIVFDKGLIISVSKTGSNDRWNGRRQEYNLDGQWVTPGIVDMHSHHGTSPWPASRATEDNNEIHPDFGPLTPFLRVIDGLKPYDAATTLIASGGVTTSLVIPGSVNIMGGEGTVIKNRLRAGLHKEEVVEDLLLERGIPVEERHRYMKMACGENPKRLYGHTRMGNAWVLRKHLTRARELLERQDSWCTKAALIASGDTDAETQHRFLAETGGEFPQDLELESTVGMLRGRVSMHNHCYEPEDLETMLRISDEFGFRVRAFHHALAAWRVPNMIKDYSVNLTVATFAECGLYKWEAYDASLYGGKILAEHDVPLAYKSDHSDESNNAKYLLSQAAASHSFHVPPDIALRAVTSVPAKALELDYRVGYVRPGYDADIVVWDAHPLSIGTTPRQVFIDGVATLDPSKVKESIDNPAAKSNSARLVGAAEPRMRPTIKNEYKNEFCKNAGQKHQAFVINGIRASFLDNYPELLVNNSSGNFGPNFTLVIAEGKVTCLGSPTGCENEAIAAHRSGALALDLANGFVTPGLIAVTGSLGLSEIDQQRDTGNGVVSPFLDPGNGKNIDFAKYGIELSGKSFVRARMGGVTRAITAPLSIGGLVRGVSAGFVTSGKRTIVNGGIFQGDVAMHINIGPLAKVGTGSLSFAMKEIRYLLRLDMTPHGQERTYKDAFDSVLDGKLPLVLHANNMHDIQQIILLKRDLDKTARSASTKIVIFGGHEASYVAKELADANIALILAAHRGAFATWENRKTLPGPPLSRSSASILSEAGVYYALAMDSSPPEGDSRIHALALEASWAAKYAGLGDMEAIQLVSRNVEEILGLDRSRDIVVWENSPLQHGGRPALAFQETGDSGTLELVSCFPDENDED